MASDTLNEQWYAHARDWPDINIVERLRRAGHVWFNNRDLLLLEELIRRYEHLRKEKDK